MSKDHPIGTLTSHFDTTKKPKEPVGDQPPADQPVANKRPSPAPHDAGYEKVERKLPMDQDDEGNDIGDRSETYTGITGHKGR